MEMPVFTIRGKNHRERGVDYGVQCSAISGFLMAGTRR